MVSHVKDLIISIGLVLLGCGAVYIIQTTNKAGDSMTDAMTFSTLPTVYACCLAILSLMLCGSSVINILNNRKNEKKIQVSFNKLVVIRWIGTFMMVVSYVFVLQIANFFLTTFCFLSLMFVLYGRGLGWKTLLAAILGAGLFHGLFIEIIHLPIQ